LPQIQRILQEFEKQSEIMDMKEEMMNDAIDDAMEDEGDEEERYLLYFPSEFVFVLYI
jgi:charged multivesicular body protein 2A